MEFLAGLLFEVPLDIAMESRQLKTWVKTLLFSLLGGGMALLFYWLTWQSRGDREAFTVLCGISIGWTALIVFGARVGHKRNWK